MDKGLLHWISEAKKKYEGRPGEQRALENLIMAFKPDPAETSELLDALIAALGNQFREDALVDVDHEYRQLKDALKELDGRCCELSDEDEAYENWRARGYWGY